MKRIISSILYLFYTSLLLFAGNEQIAISVKRHGGAHSEYYLPADMPEMYYDSDCNEIIIVADGFAGLLCGFLPDGIHNASHLNSGGRLW